MNIFSEHAEPPEELTASIEANLAVSKIVAGRPKDLVYVALLLRHRLAKGDLVRERLRATELSAVSPRRE